MTSLTLVHSDLRIALVAQGGRVGAAGDHELVADAVELVGGDAGRDMLADFDDGVGGDPSGHAHAGDRGGVLDHRVVVVGRRARLGIDVVRARDVRRNVEARRDRAGSQRGRTGGHGVHCAYSGGGGEIRIIGISRPA